MASQHGISNAAVTAFKQQDSQSLLNIYLTRPADNCYVHELISDFLKYTQDRLGPIAEASGIDADKLHSMLKSIAEHPSLEAVVTSPIYLQYFLLNQHRANQLHQKLNITIKATNVPPGFSPPGHATVIPTTPLQAMHPCIQQNSVTGPITATQVDQNAIDINPQVTALASGPPENVVAQAQLPNTQTATLAVPNVPDEGAPSATTKGAPQLKRKVDDTGDAEQYEPAHKNALVNNVNNNESTRQSQDVMDLASQDLATMNVNTQAEVQGESRP